MDWLDPRVQGAVIAAFASVLGAGAGAAASYFTARRALRTELQKLLTAEKLEAYKKLLAALFVRLRRTDDPADVLEETISSFHGAYPFLGDVTTSSFQTNVLDQREDLLSAIKAFDAAADDAERDAVRQRFLTLLQGQCNQVISAAKRELDDMKSKGV